MVAYKDFNYTNISLTSITTDYKTLLNYVTVHQVMLAVYEYNRIH